MKSINQIAQENGGSSANEGKRIRDREAAVKQAWRRVAFNKGEAACTATRGSSGRVRTIVHDGEHDLKVYHCDKHLGGPFVDVYQASDAHSAKRVGARQVRDVTRQCLMPVSDERVFHELIGKVEPQHVLTHLARINVEASC
jgi:hypothetical protein